MVEIEFFDGGKLVIIRFPKGILALPRSTFADGLRRGKRFLRQTALQSRRTTPVPCAVTDQAIDEVIDEVIAEVNLQQVDDVRHPFHPEPKPVSREKEAEVLAYLTIVLPAAEISFSGQLKNVEDLQLPLASRPAPIAVEVQGAWFSLDAWGESLDTRQCEMGVRTCWWQRRMGALWCHHAPPDRGSGSSQAAGRQPPATALSETLAPHTIIADRDDGLLQAFLQTHPSWLNHGVTQFAPEDPDWPVLWVLSQPADRAFTRWQHTGAL